MGRGMPAQLVALNNGPNILLDKPILLVGRHPECDIQIDSRKISRRHCCIAQVSDYLVVRDLGSTNGVRINGIRMTESRLSAGDELTIGNHRYQIVWDANLVLPSTHGPAHQHQVPGATQHSATLPASEMLDAEDLLESCDKPVPLPEPGGRPRPPTERPQRANTLRKTELDYGLPPPPVQHDDESVILPDHLELAPSDVFPGKKA
jgi:predicted component of type VI protein secretion system